MGPEIPLRSLLRDRVVVYRVVMYDGSLNKVFPLILWFPSKGILSSCTSGSTDTGVNKRKIYDLKKFINIYLLKFVLSTICLCLYLIWSNPQIFYIILS